MIVVRIVHILCAIFWTGATFYLAAFVIPAVKALGPDGGKFMAQLTRTNKLPAVMLAVSSLAVAAGLTMMYYLSGGFAIAWFGTPHGIVICCGASSAIIAYAVGFIVTIPTVKKIAAISKLISESGGPPAPDQMMQLQKLRHTLFTATNGVAVLLLIAALFMSMARYF